MEEIQNHIKIILESKSGNEAIARMIATAFIVKADPTIDQMEDIKTAVSEAVTNCIIHGYKDKKGEIQMEMWLCPGALLIDIKDTGCGIANVKRAMEPFYTSSPSGERSGMGFTFMKALMTEISVESEPGKGTLVHMTKRLGS